MICLYMDAHGYIIHYEKAGMYSMGETLQEVFENDSQETFINPGDCPDTKLIIFAKSKYELEQIMRYNFPEEFI